MESKNELVRQPLYDTTTLSAGVISAGTEKSFFTIPLGQDSKNLLDTNITTAGQLPYAEGDIVGIRVHAYTTNGTPISIGDLNMLLNCCTLTFKKEDRVMLEVPLYMIPSGMGLAGSVATASDSTANVSLVSNGMPMKSNFFDLLTPEKFFMRDRIQFTINVKTAFTLIADIKVVVSLEAQIQKSYY